MTNYFSHQEATKWCQSDHSRTRSPKGAAKYSPSRPQVRQNKSPTQRIPILVSSQSRWSLSWPLLALCVDHLRIMSRDWAQHCTKSIQVIFCLELLFFRENATAIECTCRRFDQPLPLTMERAEGMSLCLDTESLSLFFSSFNPWSKRKFTRLWN